MKLKNITKHLMVMSLLISCNAWAWDWPWNSDKKVKPSQKATPSAPHDNYRHAVIHLKNGHYVFNNLTIKKIYVLPGYIFNPQHIRENMKYLNIIENGEGIHKIVKYFPYSRYVCNVPAGHSSSITISYPKNGVYSFFIGIDSDAWIAWDSVTVVDGSDYFVNFQQGSFTLNGYLGRQIVGVPD